MIQAINDAIATKTTMQEVTNHLSANHFTKTETSNLDAAVEARCKSYTDTARTNLQTQISQVSNNLATKTSMGEVQTYVGGYAYDKMTVDLKLTETLTAANTYTDTMTTSLSSYATAAAVVALEAQVLLRAPKESPVFTGQPNFSNCTSVTGLNKGYVGLSLVDNTSDAQKPISSATQSALNLKADKVTVDALLTTLGAKADTSWVSTQLAAKANVASPSFSGTVTSAGNLVLDGNVTCRDVSGNTRLYYTRATSTLGNNGWSLDASGNFTSQGQMLLSSRAFLQGGAEITEDASGTILRSTSGGRITLQSAAAAANQHIHGVAAGDQVVAYGGTNLWIGKSGSGSSNGVRFTNTETTLLGNKLTLSGNMEIDGGFLFRPSANRIAAYGTGNNDNFFTAAITNPPIYNGLCVGNANNQTGSYTAANQCVVSWGTTAFVHSATGTCSLHINHSNGNITTKGAVSAASASLTGAMSAASATISGGLTVGGSATVTGAMSAASATMTGGLTVGGSATVTGDISCRSLSVSNNLFLFNATLTGTLTVPTVTAATGTKLRFGSGSNPTITADVPNMRVGIRKDDPSAALDVSGAVAISQSLTVGDAFVQCSNIMQATLQPKTATTIYSGSHLTSSTYTSSVSIQAATVVTSPMFSNVISLVFPLSVYRSWSNPKPTAGANSVFWDRLNSVEYQVVNSSTGAVVAQGACTDVSGNALAASRIDVTTSQKSTNMTYESHMSMAAFVWDAPQSNFSETYTVILTIGFTHSTLPTLSVQSAAIAWVVNSDVLTWTSNNLTMVSSIPNKVGVSAEITQRASSTPYLPASIAETKCNALIANTIDASAANVGNITVKTNAVVNELLYVTSNKMIAPSAVAGWIGNLTAGDRQYAWTPILPMSMKRMGSADIDDTVVAMPGYTLVLYDQFDYNNAYLSIDNRWGTAPTATTSTGNRCASIRVYYNGIEVSIAGVSF